MGDFQGYAVFLHEQALEVFGEAIKPYVTEGERGTHIMCREVDTSGAFVEMILDARDVAGQANEVELIVPNNAVRMIVSVRNDGVFGFVPRGTPGSVVLEPGMLPVTGPTAAPAHARPEALPDSGAAAAKESGAA